MPECFLDIFSTAITQKEDIKLSPHKGSFRNLPDLDGIFYVQMQALTTQPPNNSPL